MARLGISDIVTKLGLWIWIISLFTGFGLSAKDKGILPLAYGVEENLLLLQSIDATVSHYGDADDVLHYKRCIQHYLEFQSLFYKRKYARADQSALRMQKLLIPLYVKLIHERSKYFQSELIRLAPLTRGREKTQTKSFIQLAYRNLHDSDNKWKVAVNTRPYLYLLKLRDLLFSLKTQKQAGRYVVLVGLLHLSDHKDSIEPGDFFEIENMIKMTLTGEDQDTYRKMHWDNHFETMDKESFFSQFMKEPNMEELTKPFKDLDPAYSFEDVFPDYKDKK